jgi:hypothetical protein
LNDSSWSPSQTSWEALGLAGGRFSLVSAPAAALWGANRLDVFAVGEDGQMYHKAWDNGSWSPSWDALGYPECGGFEPSTKPAAASVSA